MCVVGAWVSGRHNNKHNNTKQAAAIKNESNARQAVLNGNPGVLVHAGEQRRRQRHLTHADPGILRIGGARSRRRSGRHRCILLALFFLFLFLFFLCLILLVLVLKIPVVHESRLAEGQICAGGGKDAGGEQLGTYIPVQHLVLLPRSCGHRGGLPLLGGPVGRRRPPRLLAVWKRGLTKVSVQLGLYELRHARKGTSPCDALARVQVGAFHAIVVPKGLARAIGRLTVHTVGGVPGVVGSGGESIASTVPA